MNIISFNKELTYSQSAGLSRLTGQKIMDNGKGMVIIGDDVEEDLRKIISFLNQYKIYCTGVVESGDDRLVAIRGYLKKYSNGKIYTLMELN